MSAIRDRIGDRIVVASVSGGKDSAAMWSRTARGGRQYELFAPETEPGCVRWGLCESMQNDDEHATNASNEAVPP